MFFKLEDSDKDDLLRLKANEVSNLVQHSLFSSSLLIVEYLQYSAAKYSLSSQQVFALEQLMYNATSRSYESAMHVKLLFEMLGAVIEPEAEAEPEPEAEQEAVA